jgi:hypothetical protein
LFSPLHWGICKWGIVLFSRKANPQRTYAERLRASCVKIVENEKEAPVLSGVSAWRNHNG